MLKNMRRRESTPRILDIEEKSIETGKDINKILDNIANMSKEEIKTLIMSPVPKGQTFSVNIYRKNTGIDKLYPKYYMYIEKSNRFLLAAKKRAGNTTSNYLITTDKDEFEKESSLSIGKLRANFMGTEFNIFDKGKSPSDSNNYLEVRQQSGAIHYDTNLFGMSGPRKMKVYIPDPKDDGDINFHAFERERMDAKHVEQ